MDVADDPHSQSSMVKSLYHITLAFSSASVSFSSTFVIILGNSGIVGYSHYPKAFNTTMYIKSLWPCTEIS